MKTDNKLASILLGSAILLLAAGYDAEAATPQINIESGIGLKSDSFEFVIKDNTNTVLCQKSGIKLGVSTPPVPCPKLSNVKKQDKFQITIGPEATIKCAPQSKPMTFSYEPDDDIMIVLKNSKECVVYSK